LQLFFDLACPRVKFIYDKLVTDGLVTTTYEAFLGWAKRKQLLRPTTRKLRSKTAAPKTNHAQLLKERDETIVSLREQLEAETAKSVSLADDWSARFAELKAERDSLKTERESLKDQNEFLQKDIENSEGRLAARDVELEVKDAQLAAKDGHLATKDAEIARLNTLISETPKVSEDDNALILIGQYMLQKIRDLRKSGDRASKNVQLILDSLYTPEKKHLVRAFFEQDGFALQVTQKPAASAQESETEQPVVEPTPTQTAPQIPKVFNPRGDLLHPGFNHIKWDEPTQVYYWHCNYPPDDLLKKLAKAGKSELRRSGYWLWTEQAKETALKIDSALTEYYG
jgi:hypothetical protein